MDKLPAPREQLAGCIWLARILEKARRFQSGTLPPEYAQRFGALGGVDGQFLRHFQLTREQIVAASNLSLRDAEKWLFGLTTAANIASWNKEAVNLGRPGFPMAERLPVALATTYKHVADQNPQTVFEALEADER